MKPFDPALLPHLRPARRALAVVLGAGLVGGVLLVAQAFALGTLVVELVARPTGSTWHAAALATVTVLCLRGLTAYAVDVAAAHAAVRVSSTLRQRLLRATLGREAGALSRERSGELTLLATRGVSATEPYLTRYVPALVLAAVLPPLTIVAIASLDWLSALIVVCTLPLIPVFAILIGLATRDRADRQWRELSALSGHFLDVVRGLPTLVAHRRARAQGRAIEAISERHRRATVDTLRTAFMSSAVLEMIATISVALVAVNVGLRLASGGLDFRTAMIVLLLAPEAYWPLRRVGAEFHAAAEGTAAFARISELTNPSAGETTGCSVPVGKPLLVRGLTVTYPGRTEPALGSVDLTIPPRGLTAITGPSGCGKSTLLAVLMGELPDAGAVSVGATPLADLDLDEWRATFAWAPQRPWLTSDTIAGNLRVGSPEASDDELWQALEKVDLGEVVAALADGLDTPLGDDGAGLSAGQRARLSLARVVLARRPWVFLDEPSAHLDEHTERVILATLRDLASTAAVVVVAHRPAVVEAADQVLALPAASRRPAPEIAVQARSAPVTDLSGVEPSRSRWGQRTADLLGSLSMASGVALTATASWLITRASEQPPVLYLMVAIVSVRTFGLARPVLRYAERLVSHDAALRLLAQRRVDVWRALVPLTPGRLGARRGDLLTSVVDDVDAIVDQRLRVRQPMLAAWIVGLGAVAFAGAVAPVAGLVIGSLLAAALLVGWWVSRATRVAEPDVIASRASLAARVAQTLEGARDLVLWGASQRALSAVAEDGNRLSDALVRSSRAIAAGRAVIVVSTAAAVAATAAWVAGPVTGPTLALFVLLPVALSDVLLPVPEARALGVRTDAAEARLAALSHRTPAVTEPASPAAMPADSDVRARNLSAGWGETPAFTGLDLDLTHGRRVAVVGPSGCGKSTLTAALLRFLDPDGGTIALGSVDTSTLAGDDVRSRIGLVDDDPHVFASTVLENVRLARPDAPDEEVADALTRAGLGGWIESLPLGTATFVGEGHAHVSGGERARIGLARALLADQPVLVLDEPTAHLDTETAERVAEQILLDDERRAVLWVTHSRVGLDLTDQVLDLGADRPVQRV